ncbi:MAG: sulfate ABC transporter permease subunit CysT [Zoogloeaceae bacterium]|jgi:sulfate transport system permease protein|nr:sulfate ABC transporter permease subunit CysT [Zoogloeaceae bacterium]
MARRHKNVLPGFSLTLGYTLLYLSLIVLIPLAAIFVKSAELSPAEFWKIVSAPRVVASYKVSFGLSLAAAAINSVFGLMLAWSLVRYSFPGKKLVDALVDLPFALPTAVAGIALTALYAGNGWLGKFLETPGPFIGDTLSSLWLLFGGEADSAERLAESCAETLAGFGLKVAYTPLGILVALIFIGLPFVVRTVQPILEDLDMELEEAAASLGARRWQTFRHVLLPILLPALLTGFALAFARAVGEYGSVIFIAGNIPLVSEITPLMIITKLEQYDYVGATAVAAVMLMLSFVLLLAVNILQAWSSRRFRRGRG